MSDQDVLKEFLIKIGYDVNETTERKATVSIDKMTKGALALGAAVTAAAVAVGAGVQRIATSFDAMYFASGRIGASAADIKAFQFAVSQLGGTSEGAMQSLENLARKMRETPGLSKQIELKTGTKITDGKLNQKNLSDIGKFFKSLIDAGKGYQAILWAQDWGFDERTMRSMAAGIDKFTDQYRRKMKAAGLDPDKAADDAQRFMKAWRDIFGTLEVIVDSALSKIMGDGKGGLTAFAAWFEKNTPVISDALAKVAGAISEVAQAWANDFEKIDWPNGGRGVAGFADEIAKLIRAFKDLIGNIRQAVEWIGKWDEKLGVSSFLNKLSGIEGNRALAGGAGGSTGGAPADTRNWWQRTAPKFLGGKEAPNAMLHGLSKRSGGATPGSFRSKAPGIMRGLIDRYGLTTDEAAIVVGNLGHESAGFSKLQEARPLIPGSRGGWGWAQWTGPRRREFEAKAAEWGLDPSSDEMNQRFLHYELDGKHAGAIKALKGAQTWEDKMRVFEGQYEGSFYKAYGSRFKYANAARAAYGAQAQKTIGASAPVAASAGSLPLPAPSGGIGKNPFGGLRLDAFKTAPLGTGPRYSGGAATTTNSTSNVNVRIDGARDADAVAREVARRAADANNRALRNGQGAVN